MEAYKKLLLANKAWAKEKTDLHSDYFTRLAPSQAPRFLWIGCSDSRVPAEEITGVGPGEFFVHRNIANLVLATDINLLSVLQYAVEVLEVKHVIVCGHYGCGGVQASLSEQNLGLINQWLSSIRNLYLDHKIKLDSLSEEERTNHLVELNVLAQVQRLMETSIVQNAWKKRQCPILHGWVYNLTTGLIKDLSIVRPDYLEQNLSLAQSR